MTGAGWQPDREAELEFARRAGMSERELERVRQAQRPRDRRQWSHVLTGTVLVFGVQLLLALQRDHGVPRARRYAVALGALALVLLAHAGVELVRRTVRRRRARRPTNRGRGPRRG